MKYKKITITTDAAVIEIISAALMNNGIIDIQIDNPRDTLDMIEGLKPTEWYDPDQIPLVDDGPARIIIYDEISDEENLAEKINSIVDGLKADMAKGIYGEELITLADSIALDVETADDSDWKDKWKEFFKPTQVSEKIMVMPTWWEDGDGSFCPRDSQEREELQGFAEDGRGRKELSIIRIDPGQAFGTGTHETTSLTLKLMEKYICEGDRVLDVGVGSGILSIAAAKLGAKEILGIDIDEEAVRVSKENFKINEVEGSACAIQGDLLEGLDNELPFDMVVANLLSDLVIKLSPAVKAYIKSGGIYISSGILIEKEMQVKDAIQEAGFSIVDTMYDGEWCSIAAKW